MLHAGHIAMIDCIERSESAEKTLPSQIRGAFRRSIDNALTHFGQQFLAHVKPSFSDFNCPARWLSVMEVTGGPKPGHSGQNSHAFSRQRRA
jgi:hypothetical protein